MDESSHIQRIEATGVSFHIIIYNLKMISRMRCLDVDRP